jgi:adenylosuccinate synthase
MKPGEASVVIDGQWGSTGKGKLVGWICNNCPVDLAVGDNMPNAGHTYVDADDVKIVLKQLPTAALFGIRCLIGPHAVINPDRFLEECKIVKTYAGRLDVSIHPMAGVLMDGDAGLESGYVDRIASTGQGACVAQKRKMDRHQYDVTSIAADVPQLKDYLIDTHKVVQRYLGTEKRVLVEGSQGFDLGLNHGWVYPFVTSRDCLVGRMADNAGCPMHRVGSIVGSLRTFPIRVGNTEKGHSGPCYSDQREMKWEEISEAAGYAVKEMTTVTGRIRRVFSFSWIQLQRFLGYVGPTHLFINFTNYLRPSERQPFVVELHEGVMAETGGRCKLVLEGTGSGLHDMKIFS